VIDYRGREVAPMAQVLAEIRLQQGLDNPGIVKMFSSGASYEDAAKERVSVVWMVQELCDLGHLTGATEAGWLRVERKITASPSMAVIIPTMGDIASGMAYLQEKGIIHADLTGRNVLLVTAEDRLHRFRAKVGDFGLARVTQDGVPICTRTLGTITHMPPELLLDNLLSFSCDVWSFAVVGWECYHGKQAYIGKNPAQVVLTVVKNTPLPWPEDAPEDFVASMRHCMSYDSSDRPPFSEMVGKLAEMSASLP